MLDDIKKDAVERMQKCVVAFRNELKRLRTGRAHPSLLEHIRVEYYGNEVPLNQVANIALEDARTITVTPWEKTMVQVIEKAIMKSDLGLMPNTAGTVIRVPMPPLSEERRREMVKIVKHEGENAKVVIRGLRRDANTELGVTVVVVTHDPLVSEHVQRTVAIRDGRTSSEVLRRTTVDETGAESHVAQEYAVLDRVGRLQLPQGFTSALQMDRRVLVVRTR